VAICHILIAKFFTGHASGWLRCIVAHAVGWGTHGFEGERLRIGSWSFREEEEEEEEQGR